ncbi:hypothetical protein ABIF50_000541 [Bradyrhizobium diazoefficiens]
MRKSILAAFVAASILTVASTANAQGLLYGWPTYCLYGYYFDIFGRLWCY